MSDLEERPDVELCHAPGGEAPSTVLGRRVVLGRTQEVVRVLPDRHVRMIGAWCFCDHYGPELVAETGGMAVWPHPHTGLATVSWLFSGEIEHRDSMGHHVRVLPGELAIMTSGYGVVHSEMTPGTEAGAPTGDDLHGVQLWVALPDAVRHMAPTLETLTDLPTASANGVEIRVLVGSLAGVDSPATVQSPLMAAQLDLAPGTTYQLAVDPSYEHGVLVTEGAVAVDGAAIDVDELRHVPAGPERISLVTDDESATLMLLGGVPFAEEVVMWWNFVGRTHQEVAQMRAQWARHDRERFGAVVSEDEHSFEAPPMPTIPIRPRGRIGAAPKGQRR